MQEEKIPFRIRDIADIDDLKGQNSLTSEELFYWRTIYKDYVYPLEYEENSVDFWYKDTFYGKIDPDGFPIYLRKQNGVDHYRSNSNNVFLVPFVLTAFVDMQNFILEKTKEGEINVSKSKFKTLEPSLGWESPEKYYFRWINELYRTFSLLYLNDKQKRDIVDFDSFLKEYINYVDKMAGQFAFTMDGLLLSSGCPMSVSGLVISFEKNPKFDIDEKKKEWLDDPLYPYFYDVCKKFGFKVDKNAPWQIVADVSSDAMQEYMLQEDDQIDPNSFFYWGYERSYLSEMETYISFLWKWYDQFVNDNPVASDSSQKICDLSTTTITRKREKITFSDLRKKKTNKYWIRLFTYVKAKEAGKNWSQQKFDSVVDKVADYYAFDRKESGMMFLYMELMKDRELDKMLFQNNLTEIERHAIIRRKEKLHKKRNTFHF